MSARTAMIGAALAIFIAIYIAALSPALHKKQQQQQQEGATATQQQQQQQGHHSKGSKPSESSSSDEEGQNLTKRLEQVAAAVSQFRDAMDSAMSGELNKNVRMQHFSEEPVPAGEADHDAAGYFSNLRMYAARDFKAGEIVLPLPARLLFGEMTADMYLKRGLDELLAANPNLAETFGVLIDEKTQRPSQSSLRTEWLVVMNLLLQMQAPSQSRWSSYLKTLPSGRFMVETFPLFASEEERLLCLSGADLRYLSALSEQRELLIQATHQVCDATIPRMPAKAGVEDATSAPLRVGAQRVHEFACHVSDDNLQWAFAVFVSRHVSLGPDPVLFPVLDAIPYATDALLRPGELRTDDEGHIVDITVVAAKDIKKGDRLTYRSALRTPWSLFSDRGTHSTLTYNGTLTIPFSWSAVQADEVDVAPGAEVCRTDAAGSSIRVEDGSVAQLFWDCAERERQLRVSRKEMTGDEETVVPKTSMELVLKRLEGDTEVVDKQCKPCDELRGLPLQRCNGMRQHTTYIREVVERFKATYQDRLTA